MVHMPYFEKNPLNVATLLAPDAGKQRRYIQDIFSFINVERA